MDVLSLRAASALRKFAARSFLRSFRSRMTITRFAILPRRFTHSRPDRNDGNKRAIDFDKGFESPLSHGTFVVRPIDPGGESRGWCDAGHPSGRNAGTGGRIRLRQINSGPRNFTSYRTNVRRSFVSGQRPGPLVEL